MSDTPTKHGFVEDEFQALQFNGANVAAVMAFLGDRIEKASETMIEVVQDGCAYEYEPGTAFLLFDDGDLIVLDQRTYELITFEMEE